MKTATAPAAALRPDRRRLRWYEWSQEPTANRAASWARAFRSAISVRTESTCNFRRRELQVSHRFADRGPRSTKMACRSEFRRAQPAARAPLSPRFSRAASSPLQSRRDTARSPAVYLCRCRPECRAAYRRAPNCPQSTTARIETCGRGYRGDSPLTLHPAPQSLHSAYRHRTVLERLPREFKLPWTYRNQTPP